MCIFQWITVAVCVMVPALWHIWPPFRFYAKVTAVGFCMVVVSFPFALGSMLRPKDVRNYKLGQWLLPTATSFLNIKWTLKGKHKLRKLDGSCIFVCNHQSFLDMIAIMSMWPERCVPMVKKELMYYGVFGLVGYLTGSVFVDRSNRRGIEPCKKAVEYLKSNNIKLWIFPEGTRQQGEEMLLFKKGAFHMAIQGQIPIVPVVISSYSLFYNAKEKKFLDSGLVIIEVLDAISTMDMISDNVNDLLEETRSVMTNAYRRISTEAREKWVEMNK